MERAKMEERQNFELTKHLKEKEAAWIIHPHAESPRDSWCP
jgi:hypothetical protein